MWVVAGHRWVVSAHRTCSEKPVSGDEVTNGHCVGEMTTYWLEQGVAVRRALGVSVFSFLWL